MVSVTFWSGGGKKPNSTAHPGGTATTLSCQITEACSVLTPTIQVTGMYPGFAYAYIPAFNRYYYVTDCVVSKTQTIITLRVDVLHTYKDAIGGTSAYIKRSSSESDNNIIDGAAVKKPNSLTATTQATSPFSGNNFLLQVAGKNGCRMFQLSAGSFNSLCAKLWNDWGETEGIDEIFANALNPFQYVISVQKCFESIGSFPGTSSEIAFGNIGTGVSGLDVTDSLGFHLVSLSVPKHPQSQGENGLSYVKSSAFSTYSLFIPGSGWISLDADDLYNIDAIQLRFNTEPNSGAMRCDVVAGDSCIASASGKININWGIGASSVDVIGMMAGAANIALDTASVGTLSGLANPTGAAKAVISDMVQTARAAMPTVQCAGGLSGCVGIYDPCKLVLKYKEVAPVNNTDFGMPLYQRKTISSIPGFVLCSDGDFGAAPSAAENEEVNTFLTGGFYYE